MSKAFFSHSSKQKTLVEILVKRIGRDNCVLDKFNFEVGGPTLDEIIKGLEKTDLFVLFLSEEALKSEWVEKEIRYAKNLKDKDISKQLLILNIDPSIKYDDIRIPVWLTKEYNLKTIIDPVLIYKKINSKLRDISILSHPFIAKKEEIFIGRNDVMNEFEKKYYNIDLNKPSVIIASGFEGVGRRKFLNNSLDKVGRLNKFHEPVIITLDTRDSIEDFILRIEDLNSKNVDEILSKIKDTSFEEKIEYAKNLLLKFQSQNEILYILDKGGIVQPNKQFATWFNEVIKSHEFNNNTIVCLVSSFRPYGSITNFGNKIISFHINELSPTDRQVLFIKYCDLFSISPPKESIEVILSVLNGMPGQIFFTAFMINEHGSEFVVKNIDEVKKYDDFKVFNTIDLIRKNDESAYNLLLFISRFEFVSFDMVYKIFGRNDVVETALEKIFIFGVYDRIGADKEYIKVHHTISDYILRAKMELPFDIKQLLKKEVNEILARKADFPDVSEILVTIKSLIENGNKIPEKYFIPSVALRTIIEYYYAKAYDQVYDLASRMLSNFRKYDDAVIRDIRYWYCMALARHKKEEFFENLKMFDGVDYFFLLGFYRRIEKKNNEAEKYFLKALEFDNESQKARRELVNALLSQGKYGQAVEWARRNYEKKKLNAFHIQAYFICLLRKSTWSQSEKSIIDELIINIQKSHDFKANEIYQVMLGEYEYYIKGNFEEAVTLLKTAKDTCEFKNYPIKALAEIYKRRGIEDQEKKYSTLVNEEDDIIGE